jgi:hypothetical protein
LPSKRVQFIDDAGAQLGSLRYLFCRDLDPNDLAVVADAKDFEPETSQHLFRAIDPAQALWRHADTISEPRC